MTAADMLALAQRASGGASQHDGREEIGADGAVEASAGEPVSGGESTPQPLCAQLRGSS